MKECRIRNGLVAGLIGGLVGTIVMTQFQNAWSKASKELQKNEDEQHGSGDGALDLRAIADLAGQFEGWLEEIHEQPQ